MDTTPTTFARLSSFGVLSVTGADARAFLHAQLTNDVDGLPADRANRRLVLRQGTAAGEFLVVAHADGFLLQLARDLAAPVAKRLAMYILRSKVKLGDASEEWLQYGLWGTGAAAALEELGLRVSREALSVAAADEVVAVCLGAQRYLLFTKSVAALEGREAPEHEWLLEEIRAGRPLIVQATQDQFVPQMANFDLIGGIDFKKGCYPGQEIVARSQYRGQVKRRLIRAAVDAAPLPGQELYAADGQASGTVVIGAPAPEGGFELLAVAQRDGGALRLGAADGPELKRLPLPYAE